jgi:hypothetical protein
MARTRAAATARRTAGPASGIPRRVSGPIRPGHPRPITAVPPRVAVQRGGVSLPQTGAAARLRALPDHRFLDTLLRSRAWIWIMGIALGGIVAMQVSLLKMNAGIGTSVQKSSELEHSNATLEEQVAVLSSGERISASAAALGLIVPDAGSVSYLTVRPGVDASRAAKNMVAPSEAARQLLASGGHPDTIVPPTAATNTLAPATGTTPTPTTTTTTTTTTTPETAAPAPAATPVPTAAPPVATATPEPTGPSSVPPAALEQATGATAAPGQ